MTPESTAQKLRQIALEVYDKFISMEDEISPLVHSQYTTHITTLCDQIEGIAERLENDLERDQAVSKLISTGRISSSLKTIAEMAWADKERGHPQNWEHLLDLEPFTPPPPPTPHQIRAKLKKSPRWFEKLDDKNTD
jgi:hypothetical protein